MNSQYQSLMSLQWIMQFYFLRTRRTNLKHTCAPPPKVGGRAPPSIASLLIPSEIFETSRSVGKSICAPLKSWEWHVPPPTFELLVYCAPPPSQKLGESRVPSSRPSSTFNHFRDVPYWPVACFHTLLVLNWLINYPNPMRGIDN